VGHVARMGRTKNAYKSHSEKLKGRDHSEDNGIAWKIILKFMLKKYGGKLVDFINLAQGKVQWLAVVNMVTNHRILQKAGNASIR